MHERQALMQRAAIIESCLCAPAMSDLNAGASRYIRYVLTELKLSPTALAKAAGIASTTITRFLNDTEYKYTISTTTIQKIAAASGINPAPFMDAKSESDIAQLAYYTPTKIYDESWPDTKDQEGKTTVVIGEVAAGQWREMEIIDIGDHPPLDLDLSFYLSSQTFAMIVRGESLNRVARDGDYLVCVRRDAMKWDFASGDLAIVQRSRESGRIVEVTAKRLKAQNGKWLLCPDSDDPRFQSPLEVKSLDDTAEVTFVGVVHFIVRLPR